MHKHTSGSERAKPWWDPTVFTSYHIWLTLSLEGWDQNPNGIETWRWGVHIHAVKDMLTELGWLVCVILIAVVCNKPAMHKMGGFASHSHNNFCSLYWISASDKAKPSAFQYGGALFFFLAQVHTLIHYSISSLNKWGIPSTQQDISTTPPPYLPEKLCQRICNMILWTLLPTLFQHSQANRCQPNA